MKKIGVVTYHSADNYGAILQSFALSKYLRNCGFSCDIIDYRCPAVEIQYTFRGRKKCFSWKNFLAHNLMCLFRQKKRRKFRDFRKLLPLSDSCTRESIADISDKYDIFLTGSDQVFNPICNKSDPTYFLDFVKAGKKVAFSASMGSKAQFESSLLDTEALLSSFSSISTREPDAAEYLSEKLGRKCNTTMDPVWLLTKKQWENISISPKRKPYIFVYNLLDLGYMKDFARELSKKTKLPIVSVHGTIMGDAGYLFCSKNASNISPSEFVGYIRDAEYVVTDSFHGTAFSILLEKKFFTGLNRKKDNTNCRIVSILEKVGLQNRIIEEKVPCDYNVAIDYNTAKKKIEPIIEFSKLYLKNCIEA